MERPMFNMLVTSGQCATCARDVERGEIVREKPMGSTAGQAPRCFRIQCQACAAAELLPALDSAALVDDAA